MGDSFFDELQNLRRLGTYRKMVAVSDHSLGKALIGGVEYIDLTCSSCLDLHFHPDVLEAANMALLRWGAGNASSRIDTGNLEIMEDLETEIAKYRGAEAGLVFSSAYLTNIGVITCLAGPGDLIVCDQECHPSVFDGAQLSRATVRVYPHNEARVISKMLNDRKSFRRAILVTDGVFFIDGDMAPLRSLLALTREYDLLYIVNDALGIGVMGPAGRGTAEHFGIDDEIDVYMGSLSAALGCAGGFITGGKDIVNLIRNQARPFMFSQGLSPAMAAGAKKAVEIVRYHPEYRDLLWKNTKLLRQGLNDLGYYSVSSDSHIISILIGDLKSALALVRHLYWKGIFVSAIRPPLVSEGQCRLRISPVAGHTEKDMEYVLHCMKNTPC